jgi:hypothetical protein
VSRNQPFLLWNSFCQNSVVIAAMHGAPAFVVGEAGILQLPAQKDQLRAEAWAHGGEDAIGTGGGAALGYGVFQHEEN